MLTVKQSIYSGVPGVKIEALRLSDKDLNTKRMNDLMAVGEGGSMPLYLHVVNRILRDMRIQQQRTGSGFSYKTFKDLLDCEDLTPAQRNPLGQRLDTLESFMVDVKDQNADTTVGWQPEVRLFPAAQKPSVIWTNDLAHRPANSQSWTCPALA